MTTSISVQIKPADSRCKYWAKVLRANCALPVPSAVDGANNIPGAYARNGDEELFSGDVLIEGEANHHRRTDRGWSYHVTYMYGEGHKIKLCPNSTIKAALKTNGLPIELLAGSGDVAACVRIAHAIRLGIAF